jgi:hypothetical protein
VFRVSLILAGASFLIYLSRNGIPKIFNQEEEIDPSDTDELFNVEADIQY